MHTNDESAEHLPDEFTAPRRGPIRDRPGAGFSEVSGLTQEPEAVHRPAEAQSWSFGEASGGGPKLLDALPRQLGDTATHEVGHLYSADNENDPFAALADATEFVGPVTDDNRIADDGGDEPVGLEIPEIDQLNL